MGFLFRERHVIDFFKGLTLPFILAIIYYMREKDPSFNNIGLWIYAATHGSYGIFWCLKSYCFGDKSWERPLTLFRFVLLVTGLSGYWVAPLLIAHFKVVHSAPYLAMCCFIYAFGVFYHFVSDMQKHMSLSLRPGVLIQEGLWSNCRNPNYFGEFLIYISFSLQSSHWLSFALFGAVVLIEWIPNMLRKDKSLSRYPQFPAYSRRSYMFLPKGVELFGGFFLFALVWMRQNM